MTADSACPFCAIIRGKDRAVRMVHSDDRVAIFFPLNPATRGHTLVVPHRHVTDLTALEVHEVHDVFDAVRQIAKALRASLTPDGLNVIQSNGRAATQTVPHVHVHVVPRWKSDKMSLSWPDTPAEDDAGQDMTLRLVKDAITDGATGV